MVIVKGEGLHAGQEAFQRNTEFQAR